MNDHPLQRPILDSEFNGDGAKPNELKRNIIVIGASAGGVEALSQLVKQLPPDLPAALFIAVHFPSHSVSLLPQILSRSGPLRAMHPQNKQPIELGKIYIAPPDYHLLVRRGYVQLSHGPRENGHRPAIDTLFRSAAHAYQQQTIGVILSGTLDDGVAGLRIIQLLGGITIAQDPNEALFDGMPRAAIQTIQIDHVLNISNIAQQLTQLADETVANQLQSGVNQDLVHPEPLTGNAMEREDEIVARDKAILEQGGRPGTASTFTCPDCGGVLWELQDSNVIRYRCHTGHAYSLESLVAEQADDLERALWSATRALEEKAALARRMGAQARQHHRHRSAAQFLERAEEAAQHADLVRQVILQQSELKLQSNNGSADETNGSEDGKSG
jgi:two-component system, chemotaxis family, protein-glutamate methylesterase/glutaminase